MFQFYPKFYPKIGTSILHPDDGTANSVNLHQTGPSGVVRSDLGLHMGDLLRCI